MIDIKDFCIISKIENFNDIKQKILEDLHNRNKVKVSSSDGKYSVITDFYLDQKFKNHNYIEHIRESFSTQFEKINREMNYRGYEVRNLWFQQYENNDSHILHNHGGASFTSIAYIELSDKSQSTVINFKDIEYQLDCNEGEIISFPGFFNHRSPANKSQRKTVIVVNTVHSH